MHGTSSTRLGSMLLGLTLALAAGAQAQAASADLMVYSGGYGLSYTMLSGAVEVCSSIRTYSYCAPVALAIPMENGVVTTENLIVAFEDYKAAIHELRLPPKALDALDLAVEGTLLPALADEINAGIVALPLSMDMQQTRANPSAFSAVFVDGYATEYYGMGELDTVTGAFRMIPDFVTGQIDATTLVGTGTADLPITVQESVVLTTPWGTETLSVSARGNLGAAFAMTRP